MDETTAKASTPQDAGSGLLGALLSNPELLGRAQSILASALSSNEKEASSAKESSAQAPSTPQTSDGLSGILSDPSLLSLLPSLLAAAKPLLSSLPPPSLKEEPKSLPVCRDNLLLALRPFLSPERCQALDAMLRIAKLGEILGQLK